MNDNNNKRRLPNDIELFGALIFYTNFAGRESMSNTKGTRSFCVAIDPDAVEDLEEAGWTVKHWDEPRTFNGVPVEYYMNVTINLDDKYYPPEIYKVIPDEGLLELTARNIGMMDNAMIENVDVTIRPKPWEYMNKTGIKAMVRNMYITCKNRRMDDKYMSMRVIRDTPDLPEDDEEEVPFA